MATIKSIEEKAKRYDRALEKAHQLCFYPTSKPFISDLQDLFPELKESEDERIKQELIEYHKAQAFLDGKPNNKHVKFVAWLEKQDDTFTKKDVDDAYLKGISDAKNELEKQGEQKSAWSEEDIEILESCISLMSYNDAAKEETDWLKSLKDRVQPQQKQEWSEEDAYKIDKITKVLDYVSNKNNLVIGQIEIEDLKNWLKSLRPQNRWKPSDEQMRALSNAGNSFRPFEEGHKVLWSLYNDLKKL